LNEKLKGDGVEKHYLALLQGAWQGGVKTIDAPLQKNSVRGGERMVMVSAEGKEALSFFKPLRRFELATLVDVEIKTGRTHQIRVHATHFGQPLAGDQKYGNKGFNRQLKKLGLKRLFLHAERLSFTLHKPFEFRAPLPDALERLLNKLD
ncbi:MAG: pseudouridine synthase, partial [Gammaproteobacteria bacterium]|nr:pseudouridine synthase [Gammaproteobacteria bacterium]